MAFSWNISSRPLVALAPMAGVTDASYRQFIKKIAPKTLLYTEFLSSDALSFGSARTMKMLEFDTVLERPFIVQIFGADPQKFLDACKVIEQMGADGIDINMGCPAAKIVSSCYGSALIRKPELAAEIVHKTVRSVSIPVSVKTRLGWDTHETLIPFCTKLEQAGAAAFAIHGRRYHDKFTGKANWEPIYALKRALTVPVLGNGDIASVDDAMTKLQNLDGVMVGRGTYGNPWLMQDIIEAFADRITGRRENGEWEVTHKSQVTSHKSQVLEEVSSTEKFSLFQRRIPLILEHCELSVRMKGERRGVLEMRRHLGSYVKGFDGAKELRSRILQMESLYEVTNALQQVQT